MNIHEKRDALRKTLADAKAISDKAATEARDLTDDESTAVDTLIAKADTLEADIAKADESAQRQSALDARIARLTSAQAPLVTPGYATQSRVPVASDNFATASKIEFPRRRAGTLTHFPLVAGLSRQEQEEKAYRFGIWGLAAFGNPKAQRWCAENGVEFQAASQEEGTNTLGGYLVPEEFDSTIIDLREQYGAFRRNARIKPMSSETSRQGRRTGGLTSYFAGEQAAITASNKTWDNVNLVAKDLYVLDVYTGQLNDDAVINVGDDLAGEIAYAFAYKEDLCGFNGTGTSTYGGIVGLQTKVAAATATLVTAASATHTNWGNILLASFNAMVGKLPQYADTPNAKWYCHKTFWASVMARLAYAAGGNDTGSLTNGITKSFLGYPVEVSQVLPSSASTAEVVCYFGDLKQAAVLGDRRGTSIAFSTDAVVGGVSMFETNQIAIRGWERFDINVHSVGDTSSAGPIVGLLTAS